MSTITSIKPQKRKDYYNLFIDDEFVCGLTGQVILDERLAIGQEISCEDIERLIKEHEVNKLMDKALNWLSFRSRSTKELIEYLRKPKGKFQEVVGERAQQIVLDRIVEKGYVDDMAFAKWWIESRNRFRPRSRRLLLLELLKKGISRNIVDQVFDDMSFPQESVNSIDTDASRCSDDAALALRIAQQNLRKYQKYEPREAKRKIAGLLARRGFSWETIKPVIDQVTKSE